MYNRRFPSSRTGKRETAYFIRIMIAIIAEKLSRVMITFLITSKLLSKAIS